MLDHSLLGWITVAGAILFSYYLIKAAFRSLRPTEAELRAVERAMGAEDDGNFPDDRRKPP